MQLLKAPASNYYKALASRSEPASATGWFSLGIVRPAPIEPWFLKPGIVLYVISILSCGSSFGWQPRLANSWLEIAEELQRSHDLGAFRQESRRRAWKHRWRLAHPKIGHIGHYHVKISRDYAPLFEDRNITSGSSVLKVGRLNSLGLIGPI